MNAKELAEKLNGRDYGDEITNAESMDAKKSGLLVVFGYSDDNVELRGVIDDEVGAYNGTAIRITNQVKVFANHDEYEIKRATETLEDAGYKVSKPSIFCTITAAWAEKHADGFSGPWHITADVPFEPFTIMEDGNPFCRGIVIDIAALNREAKP